MKLDSKIFDCIRVKPDQDRLLRDQHPDCVWRGCTNAGPHRAPVGRGHEGEYLNFCLEHVRAYNQSYNYFKDMTDKDVIDYQKSAITGHRPTWRWAGNGWSHGRRGASTKGFESSAEDPFSFFHEERAAPKPRRPVRNAERHALSTLGLDIDATAIEVKAQYKLLVKRHHPDANGGARDAEDKLREIIQAYDYLKSSGFC